MKTVLFARILFPPHIDIGDSSSRGTGRTPVDRLPNVPFFALEDGFDPSIPEVSDPATKTESERNLSRKSAVKDALDSAIDEQMRPSFLHIVEL